MAALGCPLDLLPHDLSCRYSGHSRGAGTDRPKREGSGQVQLSEPVNLLGYLWVPVDTLRQLYHLQFPWAAYGQQHH